MIWDLHVHTSMSDGSFNPREVVKYAKEKGVFTISITDHDSISGISDAKDEGEKCGVRVIPGIELSVETSREIHILGYNIDFKNEELNENLFKLQGGMDPRDLRANTLGVRLARGLTRHPALPPSHVLAVSLGGLSSHETSHSDR